MFVPVFGVKFSSWGHTQAFWAHVAKVVSYRPQPAGWIESVISTPSWPRGVGARGMTAGAVLTAPVTLHKVG